MVVVRGRGVRFFVVLWSWFGLLLWDTAASEAHNPNAASAQSSRMEASDDLSWLEERDGARAQAWVRERNERTIKLLTADPRYAQFRAAALASVDYDFGKSYSGTYEQGWVYQKLQDEAHPRGLWRRTSADSYFTARPNWQILLDVDALARAEKKDLSMITWVCHQAGERCLLGLVERGAYAETVFREFDLPSRAFVDGGFATPPGPSIPRWRDRDTVFVTSYSSKKTVTVKAWARGQPFEKAAEIFRGDAFGGGGISVFASRSFGAIAIANEIHADGTASYWTLDRRNVPRRMYIAPRSQLVGLVGDDLILLLDVDWVINGRTWKAGSLIAVPAELVTDADRPIELVMATQPGEAIYRPAVTEDAVLISGTDNVRGRLWIGRKQSGKWKVERVAFPDEGLPQLALVDPGSRAAYVWYESFLQAPTIHEVDPRTLRQRVVRSAKPQFDPNPFKTEQYSATSRDGVRVPYFVVQPKAGTQRQPRPTLLHAYGAYGGSQHPAYSGPRGRLWLERGGVYVLANVRGGAEFGSGWHVKKTERRHTYDDLAAVAEDLIARNIATPSTLGIIGLSAGGTLMGVMITQRPELFGAAVLQVPVADLLRGDLTQAGTRVHAKEWGALEDPVERKFLEATSPFQNLKAGADMPIPLVITSTADTRVHPAHSRKFAARMEQLGLPYLFYETAEGGHGLAVTPEQHADLDALIYTYLWRQLGDRSNRAMSSSRTNSMLFSRSWLEKSFTSPFMRRRRISRGSSGSKARRASARSQPPVAST